MASTLSWFDVLPRPLVGYEPSALAVCEGQAITFTNTSSYASAYLWSFGDGLTSTLTNTVHVYSDSLTATVALTGTNCCGYATVTETITVYDTPWVEFMPSEETIYTNQLVTFTVVSSETVGLSYFWDFGDGAEGSTDINPTHKFKESGWYTVTLTTDDKHCTGITSMKIYVNLRVIYLPVTINKPTGNITQPDSWDGSMLFALVISLGLVALHPLKRR
jgi:PKD repeat protein